MRYWQNSKAKNHSLGSHYQQSYFLVFNKSSQKGDIDKILKLYAICQSLSICLPEIRTLIFKPICQNTLAIISAGHHVYWLSCLSPIWYDLEISNPFWLDSNSGHSGHIELHTFGLIVLMGLPYFRGTKYLHAR